MWKPLIRCSLVGGVVVFLWMMVTWMVLPMHKMTMNKFADASEVTSTITRYAPYDGIYVIPSWENGQMEKGRKQPFIFVNIRRGVDVSQMACPMVVGLVTQIVGAFLITYLLLRGKAMKYWNRVWFITIAGGAVAVLGIFPAWNWWYFPASWTILGMFDMVVGWFLGGLVIAKLVKN